MKHNISFLFLIGVLFILNGENVCFGKDDLGEGEIAFTNTWAVELDTEDENVARDIAKRYGYDYGGKIGSLPRHFIFNRPENAEKSLLNEVQDDESAAGSSDKGHKDYKRVLESHPRVKWAERQAVLQREKQIDKH